MLLAVIAIMPEFAGIIGINSQFAYFFGGTSLLILVSVVLDTLQQIETHLLNRHYDGLTTTGTKIKEGMHFQICNNNNRVIDDSF
jgi:preprotein translocase subunit SecY